jgi:hypothetical protein
MSANRTIALIGVLLAAALLAAAGPAMAHPSAPIVAPVPPTPEAAIPSEAPPPAPVVTTSADLTPGLTPGLTPWIAAGALVLTGVALRRRPRRILVLCLVLLLTLFAFENALHSVHHGLDPKQADACAIATASAHLSAVAVDAIVETSIVLVDAGHAAEPDLSTLPALWHGPDQGRAPPAPAA